MKKLILFLLVYVAYTIGTYGQEKIGLYRHNNYVYEITSSPIINGKFTVTFQIETYNKKGTKNSFTIESDKLDGFVRSLLQANDKFVEWTQVAKKNYVSDIEKDMDITFPVIEISGFGSTNNYFSERYTLKPSFSLEYGKAKLVFVNVPPNNSKMNYDNFIFWRFEDSSDIQNLVRMIKPENIKAELNKKKSNSDLFK